MTGDWKTLRVPVEAWETAKVQKEENGRTWGDQIVRGEDDSHDVPPGIAELMKSRGEDLERIKELVEKAPERTADEVEGRLR